MRGYQWSVSYVTWKNRKSHVQLEQIYKPINFRFGVLVPFLNGLKTDRLKEIICLPWVTLLLFGSHEDKKGKNCFSQANKEARWPFHSLQSGCKTKQQTTPRMLSYKEGSRVEWTHMYNELALWRVCLTTIKEKPYKQKGWVILQPGTHLLSKLTGNSNSVLCNTGHLKNPLGMPEADTLVLPSALRFLPNSIRKKELLS